MMQVILDGVVYDLAGFAKVHPGGGDMLHIFGGSDATAHYYMLHQHQQIKTTLLEPYKLRKAEPVKVSDMFPGLLGRLLYMGCFMRTDVARASAGQHSG